MQKSSTKDQRQQFGRLMHPVCRLVMDPATVARLIALVNSTGSASMSTPTREKELGSAADNFASLGCLAVAALANAINIIEGFKGLASTVASMMFASLANVGFQVHDPVVLFPRR
jgi:UDP-N-acetylmuramyl pentapeptide phosphotransferase/UDP-N-acetylglucosamine-1-phosphate transferase